MTTAKSISAHSVRLCRGPRALTMVAGDDGLQEEPSPGDVDALAREF
jgi:hypothetical protein